MHKPLLTALAALAATCASAPTANAAETLRLDSRAANQNATIVSTAAPLASGAEYVVTMTGTASIFRESLWKASEACGVAEARPMVLSPDAGIQPAGLDAATIFSLPPKVGFNGFRCTPAQIPFAFPARSSGGVQFDLGAGFRQLDPIGGRVSVPRDDHTYNYSVVGTGTPMRLRFSDLPNIDNNGVFVAVIRTRAECDADATCGAQAVGVAQQPQVAVAGLTIDSGEVAGRTARTCISGRVVRFKVRIPRGIKVVKATARFGSRRATGLVRGRHVRFRFSFERLPGKRGRTVKVVAITSRGQRLKMTKRYRTCSPKSTPKVPNPTTFPKRASK